MALTKITAAIIEDGAITASSIADTSITADKLHTTLDLTGKAVTVATATAGDNDTTVASTAFVSTAIANLADSAPSTLDTLNELAAALGDDANFSTTVTNSIATKAPLASPDFTGDATFDTTALVVDATNDRVGIGTSSPGAKLHIESAATNEAIRINTATGYNAGINYYVNNAIKWTAQVTGDGTDAYRFYNFASGEAMRIDSSDKVGIGTNSPSTRLTVRNDSENVDNYILEIGNDLHATNTKDAWLKYVGGAATTDHSWTTGIISNTYRIVQLGARATAPSSGTERLVINSDGNIGIGTTSPNQDGFGSSSRVLTVKAPSSGGTGALELIGLANSSGDLMSAINFMSYAVTSPAARITALRHTSDTEASISFDTSGAERMRITPTQTEVSFLRANSWQNGSLSTVGGPALEIGTSGSSGYVHGYNRNTSSYIPVSYDGSEHKWYKSGTGPSATLNTSGQFLINFSSPASTSNFLLGVDGSIGIGGDDFIAAGAGYGPANSSAGAGTIQLYNTATGNMNFNQSYSHARYYFYHGGNEVFRIEDGGFSGIYGYSFYYTTQYGSVGLGALNSGYHHTMAASGPSTFYWNNRCEASGGFHTYSDERLKENITTISGALDKVALMNGVTFNWIDAENRGSGDTGKQFGVIAQNMLTVDPELPSLNPDPLATQEEIDNEELETDYYTMDYSRITPFLIEAIKELKTKLEAAEARITTLEG